MFSFENFISYGFEYFVLFAVLAILYFWYIVIVARRNKALEALSGIDVQLKNRLDLIPNILKIAKKFMEHETEIFGEVTALREGLERSYDPNNIVEIKHHLKMSQALAQKMQGFMLRAENYPELRSSENMLQAQRSYNEVEAQIAAARRFYNSAVMSLANAIQIFPGNILATMADIKTMPLFEAEEAAKSSIDADKFL